MKFIQFGTHMVRFEMIIGLLKNSNNGTLTLFTKTSVLSIHLKEYSLLDRKFEHIANELVAGVPSIKWFNFQDNLFFDVNVLEYFEVTYKDCVNYEIVEVILGLLDNRKMKYQIFDINEDERDLIFEELHKKLSLTSV
jgi:hypothetical protein